MTRDVERNILGMIAAAFIAFIIGFAAVHAARSDTIPLEHGKFYVTVTLFDQETQQKYAKLVFNPAGAFADRETCIAWVVKKDPEFIKAGQELLNQAREQFGPGVMPKIDCETPPEKGTGV